MEFRNRYLALRHGISVANERGVIISRPENGTRGWGLSPFGTEHCRQLLAPEQLVELAFCPQTTITISSDFTRALETAEIFVTLNGLSPAIQEPRLRERCFGLLEHQDQQAYLGIWELDADDAEHHQQQCESTTEVAARLRSLLDELERRHSEKQIVLVSHGDPLQILETIFRGLPCNRHRTLAHLGNCELRRLN